jgi:PAS domain S-box-containing protein
MKFKNEISVIVVTLIYLGAARLGLSLAFLHASVSPVWPPTGVAIAAVLWLGYRISPAILVGAFLANLATGVPVATAGGIAFGNTLEAVSAAYLLRRYVGSGNLFNRAQDVWKFALIAGLVSPALSATIGDASLCLGGAADWSNFGKLWLTWWLGDGSGALVLTPFLLAWLERRSEHWTAHRLAEAALLLVSLSGVALIVFGGFIPTTVAHYPLGHLTIPILLWAAFRFGTRGAATAIVLLSGIATWGTTRGFGPFAEGDLNESLLLLQVFVVAVAITALVLAAVVTEHKRAQSELSFLASIVESTDDAVIGKTLEGTLVSWNEGAEQVFGYAAREIIGRSISVLIPSDRTDELPYILETVGQGNHIEFFETQRLRKDGTPIDVSLTISPIKTRSGEVIGASTIARDITERKRAQMEILESEARLRLALDAGKMGRWDYDIETQEVKWSTNLEIMHGLDPGTFGGTFDDYLRDVHPEDHERVTQTIVNSLAQSAEHHVEYRIIWPDGSVHWVSGTGRVVTDATGRPLRMTGICRDITARKQAEAELEDLLMREQAARADAETANRAKDEFLALVSHELRTPLNAIVGWVDILLKNLAADDFAAHALEVIKRNADLQVRIIEDILDVSRIIAGKLQLEVRPLEMTGIIQAAVAAVQPAADAKSVRLRTALSASADPVSGDGHRLQQVVWNLLSNAIKFTPAGGDVEVRLEQLDSNARILVTDTGEGIASEFLPHIFDRFRQADSSRTRRHGGLGLGLAIVRHLVELHGGNVEAFSEGRGHGARFVVTLPCAASIAASGSEQRDRSSDNANTPLRGVRILVVDDDGDSREVLATLLSLQGAETKLAATVREALTVWDDWNPDVLVSDIGLPIEDGYDLIRAVRMREANAGLHVPAIALTGYAGVDDGERALSEGYELHLAKPVDPKQLISLISGLARPNGQRPDA